MRAAFLTGSGDVDKLEMRVVATAESLRKFGIVR